MSVMTRIVRNRWLLLVLSAMMLGLSTCGPAPQVTVTPEDEVFFPDSNLETAVRRAIRKYQGPVQASDLEELTSFSLAGKNVTDLTGLEHFVNLERLEIHDSRISDISPLASLRNLTELVMEPNQIRDMSPLDSLTDLIVRRVVFVPDKRLEEAIRETIGKPRGPIYITELEEIISLSLSSRNVTDLTGLEYCVNLERLELHGNRISDLSPLASLANLTELVMEPNQFRDLSPLDSLADLTVLEAVVFPDRNLEAAIREAIDKPEGPIYTSDLEEVIVLSLPGRKITDLTGLEYCVNLKTLEINDNSISDMSSLAALTNLTTLVVDPEQIRRTSPVASLTDLTVLEVVDIPDPNLEAAMRDAIGKLEGAIYASDLEQLTSFSARGVEIADLTGLEYCTGLDRLYLEDDEIVDIAPLAGLTNLSVLSLRNNQIIDIAPLARLSSLGELYIDGNEVSDIARLAGLTSLIWLSLSRNQIGDVSPLASLTNLVWLWLHGNELGDVSPLASMKNLSVLVLEPGDVEGTSLLGSLANTTVLLAVSFPDVNLEAAIREAIHKPEGPIYTHELEALTALSLSGRDLTDLTGLEYCTSLKRLELHDNEISDLSSLAALTSLTRLYLHDNQISDISPLASLVNLTDLRLHNNLIVDIAPLVANSGLLAPDVLTLANNPLDTTSQYVHIPKLEERGVTVSW